eukprot:2086983-Rhodomonas_salina.1
MQRQLRETTMDNQLWTAMIEVEQPLFTMSAKPLTGKSDSTHFTLLWKYPNCLLYSNITLSPASDPLPSPGPDAAGAGAAGAAAGAAAAAAAPRDH